MNLLVTNQRNKHLTYILYGSHLVLSPVCVCHHLYLLSDGEYLAIAWSINLLLCLNVFLVVCCAVCVIPSCASSFFLYLYVTLIVAVLWWGVCRALLGALVDCSLVSPEIHPFRVLVYFNKFFMAVQCHVSFPIPYLFLYCSLYCLLLMSSSFFSPIAILCLSTFQALSRVCVVC